MAQPNLAGKVVRCPTCGQSFQVPKPAAPRQMTVACGCGKTYPLNPALYGKQVRCQACGRQFVVPTPGRSPSPAPQPDPLATNNPLDGLGDLSNWGVPTANSAMNIPMGAATIPTTTYSAPVAKPKRKSSFKVNKKLIAVIGLSILAVVAIAGIGVAAFTWLPIGGYRSPQAVFDAHYRAQANRDWNTMFNTLTPESQSQMTGMLAGMLSTLSAFDPKIGELVKKYGITAQTRDVGKQGSDMQDLAAMFAQMQKDMAAAADAIKDKRAFFVDVMSEMEELAEDKGANFSKLIERSREAELKDVVIDGDTARGTQSVTLGSSKLNLPVAFRKIDGGWRIELAGLNAAASAAPNVPSATGGQSTPAIPPAATLGQGTNQNPNPNTTPSQPKSQGNNSPAAVFTAHKQAYASRDWATVFDTVTPDSQARLAGALVYSTHSVSRIDQQLSAVYARYGVKYDIDRTGGTMVKEQDANGGAGFIASINPELEIKRAMNTVQDKRGFFVDVLRQKEYEAERVRGLLRVPEGIVTNIGTDNPLRDVIEQGDQARAIQQITFDGQPVDIRVGFQRVDGKWRLDLASLQGALVKGRLIPQAVSAGK